MSLVTNWITKLPRLKNAKVARFSYKAEAYANDDIEGVENYDYSRDMNVPLATHTDFDPDVLSIGARTHFSSVTKNGLNHFFGRVSYNLNKVLDFLVDFLTDFIALNNSFISFTEIVSFSSSATLSNYANGSTKRLLNTAGSTITITLPVGETYLGSNTITLAPSIMLTITKRGTVWINSSGNAITAITADKWKTARNVTISDADGTNTGTAVPVDGSENETLKLPPTIKASITGNASTATAIKQLENTVSIPAEETSVTNIIKVGTVQWFYSGTIKLYLTGTNISDSIEIKFVTENSSGAKVLYGKLSSVYGTVSCTITSVSGTFDSNRDIYIAVKTAPNGVGTVVLGVVTSDRGTLNPSMAIVESVTGTVLDSITITGKKGEVSSLSHTFQKDITGNLIGNVTGGITGNAATADKWKTARNVTISDADGTNTGTAVSVDGSENETLKLPATIKANLVGNASKANVRVSLRHGNMWFDKTWAGLTGLSVLDGTDIWTDRENIYLSTETKHFILNKATSTWVAKTWTGLSDFYGKYVWTDGTNIYNNSTTRQFILNKDTLAWSAKTWNGLTYFDASYIWKDGENIYYSSGTAQYVLNKATSTWVAKTWNGLPSFDGHTIWTDGDAIYHSSGTTHYVLNKANATWSVKTWSGLTHFNGSNVWTDGDSTYYNLETAQYVLNKATSTWVPKIWNNTDLIGAYIWTDGDAIYHDNAISHVFLSATRHNYVDDSKYNPLLGKTIRCSCSTLSDWFVFRNE